MQTLLQGFTSVVVVLHSLIIFSIRSVNFNVCLNYVIIDTRSIN